MSKELSNATFDYTDFDADSKGKLINLAGHIRSGRKSYNAAVFKVGESIAAAHAILAKKKTGTFGKWIEQECGLEERTAANYMHTWQTFGDQGPDLQITTTAMYLLSAPEAPPKAAKEAIKRADKGERITVSAAKELLDKFREVESKATPKKSKPAIISDLQPVAEKQVTEIEPSKTPEKEPESDDPIGDKCSHDWDEEGDCKHCKIPIYEVIPQGKLFKELMEHIRLSIRLADALHNATGRKSKRHEEVLNSLDIAGQSAKKWRDE